MRSLLLPCVLLAACSAAQSRPAADPRFASPPSAEAASIDDPRSEISRLEGRIRLLRGRSDDSTQSAESQQSKSVAAAPAAAPASPTTVEATAPRFEAADSPGGNPASPRRSQRCQQVDRVSDEICRAAARICALARDLDDEAARGSCLRAEADCTQSRIEAEGCR